MRTRPQTCLSPLGRGLTHGLHQTLRITSRRCGSSHPLALGRLDTRSCQWLTRLRRLSRSRIGRVPEAESAPAIPAAKVLRGPSGCSSVFPTASPPAEKTTACKDQARQTCTYDGTGDREWVPADRLHHREFGRTGRDLKLARAVEGIHAFFPIAAEPSPSQSSEPI